MQDAMSLVRGALAHKEQPEKVEHPKKHIKEMRVRHGHKGGYIAEHHHTAPEVHPMEEHVIPDQDGLVDHMMQNMGTPNPGEAEADAGQPEMASAPQQPQGV